MINVSNDFKARVKEGGRKFFCYIDDNKGTRLTGEDNLKHLSIKSNGGMFQTVLREAKATYFGGSNLVGKEVNIGIGLEIDDNIIEYIDYGKFRVVQAEENQDTGEITVKMYDKMYDSLRDYYLFNVTYPKTLREYLEVICEELGWELSPDSFYNENLQINAELFMFFSYTFRDVLEQIAEITGSIIGFTANNKLKVFSLNNTLQDSLTPATLKTLRTEAPWKVNSIAFAQNPIETNFIYRGGYISFPLQTEDGESILAEDEEPIYLEELSRTPDEGLAQILFTNNFIIDQNGESYIDSFANQFLDFEFVPFKAETIFLGYFELGDKVTIQGKGSAYDTYITSIELDVGLGVKETISLELPNKIKGNHKKEVGIIQNTIANTQVGERNIQDNSITSAKIKELNVSKLISGNWNAIASLGEEQGGDSVVIDGEESRILIKIKGIDQILIGKQKGGF